MASGAPAGFRWNYGALETLINSRYGGTARLLEKRAVAIENQAKINASVSDGIAGPRGATRRTTAPGLRAATGQGRASIAHEMGLDGTGLYARIGTNQLHMAIQELQQKYVWLKPALDAETVT